MDYYKILGLARGASADEIKKAYRSLAMKHHPDRGGSEAQFKDIATAYDILSDPTKKQRIDMGQDPAGSHPGFGGGGFNPFDFFHSGFGGGFQQAPRNSSLSIHIEVTLEDVCTGKSIDAELAYPSGQKKTIKLEVPVGIHHGQQIRYQGMGDDSVNGVPVGDLIVNISVRPHRVFRREGDALSVEKTISVWDALLGTYIQIITLDGRTLNLTIPPGTQPETVLSCNGEGLPNMQTKRRGNLLIKIKIKIPKDLSADQIQHIQAVATS
jgi:DnaJ-class molecular chaperone